MEFDGFEWDVGNLDKCRKHGVTVEEIENLFLDDVFVNADVHHSVSERRFRAIGKTNAARGLFVVFAWRVRNELTLIRPISARYMHRKEVEAYEKAIS